MEQRAGTAGENEGTLSQTLPFLEQKLKRPSSSSLIPHLTRLALPGAQSNQGHLLPSVQEDTVSRHCSLKHRWEKNGVGVSAAAWASMMQWARLTEVTEQVHGCVSVPVSRGS